jgi:ribonuclease P protein component
VRQPFILQMERTPVAGESTQASGDGAPVPQTAASRQDARIGFTASRKIGGAVSRNRAKRRLRAAAAAAMPGRVKAGHDYVLVARSSVLTCVFANLVAELISALDEMPRRQAAQQRARQSERVPQE